MGKGIWPDLQPHVGHEDPSRPIEPRGRQRVVGSEKWYLLKQARHVYRSDPLQRRLTAPHDGKFCGLEVSYVHLSCLLFLSPTEQLGEWYSFEMCCNHDALTSVLVPQDVP